MGSLKNWYKRSPFWEVVASAFDLFGVLGLSIDDVKKSHQKKGNIMQLKRTSTWCDKT